MCVREREREREVTERLNTIVWIVVKGRRLGCFVVVIARAHF